MQKDSTVLEKTVFVCFFQPSANRLSFSSLLKLMLCSNFCMFCYRGQKQARRSQRVKQTSGWDVLSVPLMTSRGVDFKRCVLANTFSTENQAKENGLCFSSLTRVEGKVIPRTGYHTIQTCRDVRYWLFADIQSADIVQTLNFRYWYLQVFTLTLSVEK